MNRSLITKAALIGIMATVLLAVILVSCSPATAEPPRNDLSLPVQVGAGGMVKLVAELSYYAVYKYEDSDVVCMMLVGTQTTASSISCIAKGE